MCICIYTHAGHIQYIILTCKAFKELQVSRPASEASFASTKCWPSCEVTIAPGRARKTKDELPLGGIRFGPITIQNDAFREEKRGFSSENWWISFRNCWISSEKRPIFRFLARCMILFVIQKRV